jgi:excinuclease ABC subunit B
MAMACCWITRGHHRTCFRDVTAASFGSRNLSLPRRYHPQLSIRKDFSVFHNWNPLLHDSFRRNFSSLLEFDTGIIDAEVLLTDAAIAEDSRTVPATITKSLFQVTSKYKAAGDQPQAIQRLTEQLEQGDKFSVLRGITGTGKTFVMAHVIANIGKPCLVLCHNKTLAAQLARELRSFLSENAVELFVSYYNMYKPEAFIEKTGKYLAKKSSVNAEIDALRHRATRSLLTRNDVVVVASVSCIYGLGFPTEYIENSHKIEVGQCITLMDFYRMLDTMLYTVSENDENFERGQYQSDDNMEMIKSVIVWPPHEGFPMQILLQKPPEQQQQQQPVLHTDDKSCVHVIQSIGLGNPNGFTPVPSVQLFPAKHHIVSQASLDTAMDLIEKEMHEQVKVFRSEGKAIEAERLQARVIQDLALLRENGYCNGCENYSRHFGQRDAGEPPETLIDYFGLMGKRDWLLMVDESHVTLSQISSMHVGDRQRKLKLVKHGYRLPSALDNRPLNDKEFWSRVDQAVFVSATPSKLELSLTERDPIEMIIRPTFVCDPEVEVRPSDGQLQNLLLEVKKRAELHQRTLAVTLTKRDAVDMSDYLTSNGLKSTYLHSGLTTNERSNALKALQNGEVDCLVGVNLLREGLDLPQVSLVAILSADKQGFLRSETSIMQTIGRAARNIEGKAILYGKQITESMRKCIDETNRRRSKQSAYNEEHGKTAISTKGTSTMSIFDLAKKEIESEMEFKIPTQKKKAACGVAEAESFLEELQANSIEIPSEKSGPKQEANAAVATDHIPSSPGIYTWRDSDDKILYIGKAVNLRSRVRSYLAKGAKHSQRIKSMIKRATSVSFVLTPSERDALILESNLIKHHQPRYNVLLKDDNHYPYICATCGDEYPRLMVVPVKQESALTTTKCNRYFGPYTNFNEINTILDRIEDKFDLRGQSFQARYGSGSKEDYQLLFEKMMQEVFTDGAPNDTLQDLRSEYEQAGVLFESKYNNCRDVVAVGKASENDDSVVVHVMQLRTGLVAGRFTYSCQLPTDNEEDYADAIFAVLTGRHYPSGGESRGDFCWFPDDILLSHMPPDVKSLKSTIRGLAKDSVPKKTSLTIKSAAKKGNRFEVDKRTLELAFKNANQAAFEKSIGDMNIGIVDGSGALELAKLVGCEKPPSRIECYVRFSYLLVWGSLVGHFLSPCDCFVFSIRM